MAVKKKTKTKVKAKPAKKEAAKKKTTKKKATKGKGRPVKHDPEAIDVDKVRAGVAAGLSYAQLAAIAGPKPMAVSTFKEKIKQHPAIFRLINETLEKGRPHSLTHDPDTIDIEMVQTLAAYGLRNEEIASLCAPQPMSRATFARIVNQRPEVQAALEKGRAIAASNRSKALYERATRGTSVTEQKAFLHKGEVLRTTVKKDLAPDVTAMIFYLKTQCGWKESVNLEHTGGLDVYTEVARRLGTMTEEERLQRQQQLANAQAAKQRLAEQLAKREASGEGGGQDDN